MIEEVKQIFDDIRDAIIEMGGDIDMCSSPEEYAEAIKDLSGNNAVLFIPCFKASETKPATPTKTVSPADPTDYPTGGGTPDGLVGKIWMTYTIVSVSNVYVPWTEPVLLGIGEDPIPPAYDAPSTRTFVICLELPDADVIPNAPTGGLWDIDNNILLGTIENPDAEHTVTSVLSNGNTAQGSSNNNHVPGGYTGMSVGTFIAEDGSLVGEWSDPMCINSARDGRNGLDGRNGVDGSSVEFIYRLCTESNGSTITAPESADYDYIDDYVPPDGTNHPSSIDQNNYPIEIMCQRKKDKSTGRGGPFIGPVLGARGGQDGMDGDGIEYIFRVATNAEVTQDANGKYHLNDISKGPPTCADDCANAFYTIASDHGYTRDELTEIYQQDDGVPGNDRPGYPTAETIGGDRNWTDDPLDVDINEPFEFVSTRKYNGETGTGGGFSTPVLGNKYYATSAPIFTSYVFCRSTKNLGNMILSGGTVLSPFPSDQTIDGELIHGYDTVPGATEYGAESTRAKAPIGMACSKFGSADPTVVIAPNGSSPSLMADSKYFNVEYSNTSTFTTPLPKFDAYLPGVVSGKDYPFIDNASSEGIDESEGRSYCSENGYGTGDDSVNNPKGMATCTFEEGHGTDGTVTKIHGEDGANGVDGTNGVDGDGIEYVYIRTNSATAPTITNSSDTHDGKTYLNDDYLPLSSSGRCTDNPSGVTNYAQYEYVASRSKNSPNSNGKRTGAKYAENEPMKLWAKGGEKGDSGLNQALVTLYKSSVISPAVPSTITTYTFATGVLSGTLDGWSQTMPSISGNNVCWVTQANIVSDQATYQILGGKTTNTPTPGDWSEPRQLTGTRGPIGPKMRMRNGKTDYGTPPVNNIYVDTDGQNGGLNGEGANDAFYDVAIYPTVEGGIDTNVANASDRLGRCVQPLSYEDLATIITQAGDADSVYPGSTYLRNYFTQAVGWDFVATNLLLANKINADQIDVNGLSAKSIVTDVTDNSYVSAYGNTIELKKNGATKCKISGNPITVNASSWVETIGDTPLGYRFAGGSFDNGWFTKTIDLGSFEIKENSQHRTDTIKSTVAQQINLDFIGTGKQNVGSNTSGNVGVYGTAILKARNQSTQHDTIWQTAGYGNNIILFDYAQVIDPGNVYSSGDGATIHPDGKIDIDTTVAENFSPGVYNLILEVTIVDGISGGTGLNNYFENMELYLSQYQTGPNSGIGVHSPIVKTEVVSSEIQYTDIGTDGFAHVLDGSNYFFVRKDNNSLKLEFFTGGSYGLRISSSGIEYTKTGPSGGTNLV